jgi:Skp family chaperone for outer membrane proteins
MTMKKILLTALFISICGLVSLRSQDRSERIEALKVAFITKQLQLTPQEAEKFWPVYNVYENEMKNMIKDHRQKGGSEIELEEKILNLHKKYKPDFLKVISEDKFNKLMTAERTWAELLRKELQRRREGGGKPLPRDSQ